MDCVNGKISQKDKECVLLSINSVYVIINSIKNKQTLITRVQVTKTVKKPEKFDLDREVYLFHGFLKRKCKIRLYELRHQISINYKYTYN